MVPEDDVVPDETKTRELINEIKRLLSGESPHLDKVSSELAEALRSNLPLLSHALKEGFYVWLSRHETRDSTQLRIIAE